jgi:hypothetical protein
VFVVFEIAELLSALVAYIVYVKPKPGGVYDIVIEVSIILDTVKDVGAAGADNAVVELDSKEIPLLEFVAIAVIVYVVLFESSNRVATPL